MSPVRRIKELRAYRELVKNLGSKPGEHAVFGIGGGGKSLFTSALVEQAPAVLLVVSDEKQAQFWASELAVVTGKNPLLFPALDWYAESVIFADNREIHHLRLGALRQLLKYEKGIIIAGVAALNQPLVPPAVFRERILHLSVGGSYPMDELLNKLTQSGYSRTLQVEQPGQFAVRGAIVDIFPPGITNPYRLEFFGDELDSLRIFSVADQRTVENIREAEILPASELIWEAAGQEKGIKLLAKEIEDFPGDSERKHKFLSDLASLREGETGGRLGSYFPYFHHQSTTLLEYFPQDSLIIWDDPARIAEEAKRQAEELEEIEDLLPRQKNFLHSFENLLERSKEFRFITLSLMTRRLSGHQPVQTYAYPGREVVNYHGQENFLIEDLKNYLAQDYSIVLSVTAQKQELLRTQLDDLSENIVSYRQPPEVLPRHAIAIMDVGLSHGLDIPDIGLLVLTERELYGSEGRRRFRVSSAEADGKERLLDYRELKEGDYVVHVSHGIGIYQGIRTMAVQSDIQRDYLYIRYKGNDRLYVPIEQLSSVQKYVGGEGEKPKVYSLGGGDWQRVKSRVKKSVENMAEELLAVHARRQASSGFAYPPDGEWQSDFESSFIYTETPDQLRTIEEIKRDMEQPRPMDRILCGDVGFGKTEVALRAAFKAATAGKQVAILVPTTVLAHQHYRTTLNRLADFPLRVEMMSRFRTPTENKKVAKDLSDGLVDIVIGTHALLNKDVKFHDLGLLIVDEEQRFGVRHKEKIKAMKEGVDVLTLSATPIPRTLHMSMLGMRDLSLIETPPADRYPIQTYVLEYNDDIVRRAVLREMERGGQVYYLHNRVRDIESVAIKLQELLPEARIAVGHGQMSERQLEKIIIDFYEGRYDILISTTIIENGLDIPNVNTLIVENADNLGLAQLYQIRGRVGRTNRLAFAYLTYRPDKVLTESAEKRLLAIKEFTELGSGFKIALRDLQIRGAGNLLGPEQSGFMAAVGYDLYVSLLEEVIAELSGKPLPEKAEIEMDLGVNAYLPERYIRDSELKIEIYKRVMAVRNSAEAAELTDEVVDRFGDPPMEVRNLLLAGEIRALAQRIGVREIKRRKGRFILLFGSKDAVDPQLIQDLWQEFGKRIQMSLENDLPALNFWIAGGSEEDQLLSLRSLLVGLNKVDEAA